jgi:predicted ABC-type transport system involved in lysophospholipase L1 biosynthesis ATPase subunit
VGGYRSVQPASLTPGAGSDEAASPDTRPYIVEARALTKSYRRGAIQVVALAGVDFAVRRGEMVAIMGPSGCGKTTLLNCLAGLDGFDGGDVLVEGRSLRAMSDDARATYRARRMGFVFQAYNLIPVLTALENVELPLLLAGASALRRRWRTSGSHPARRTGRPSYPAGNSSAWPSLARS